MSLFSCDCLSIAYAGKKVLSDVSFSVNSENIGELSEKMVQEKVL